MRRFVVMQGTGLIKIGRPKKDLVDAQKFCRNCKEETRLTTRKLAEQYKHSSHAGDALRNALLADCILRPHGLTLLQEKQYWQGDSDGLAYAWLLHLPHQWELTIDL